MRVQVLLTPVRHVRKVHLEKRPASRWFSWRENQPRDAFIFKVVSSAQEIQFWQIDCSGMDWNEGSDFDTN